MNSKKLKEKAIETLRCLEDNGGQEVSKVIKSAIPTYSSTWWSILWLRIEHLLSPQYIGWIRYSLSEYLKM